MTQGKIGGNRNVGPRRGRRGVLTWHRGPARAEKAWASTLRGPQQGAQARRPVAWHRGLEGEEADLRVWCGWGRLPVRGGRRCSPPAGKGLRTQAPEPTRTWAQRRGSRVHSRQLVRGPGDPCGKAGSPVRQLWAGSSLSLEVGARQVFVGGKVRNTDRK